jgi:hypothetical protein
MYVCKFVFNYSIVFSTNLIISQISPKAVTLLDTAWGKFEGALKVPFKKMLKVLTH